MMITREDHVSIITYPTDMKIVEHEDGTRITTFTKEVEKSASEGEEKQGMRIKFINMQENAAVISTLQLISVFVELRAESI